MNRLSNFKVNVDFSLCPSAFCCLSPNLLCVQRQSSLVSFINLTDKKELNIIIFSLIFVGNIELDISVWSICGGLCTTQWIEFYGFF